MSHHVEAKITIGLQSFNLHFGSREIATIMEIPVNQTKVYEDTEARIVLAAMRGNDGQLMHKLIDSIDSLAGFQCDIQDGNPKWCVLELSHYG